MNAPRTEDSFHLEAEEHVEISDWVTDNEIAETRSDEITDMISASDISRSDRAMSSLITALLILFHTSDLPRVIASSQEKMQLKKYYLARGLTGRIDCPVDANPPASVIMWSKNDRFIVPSNNQRLRISKHGMLIIRDIDSRDEGFYSCLPYSPLGKGNKSESFQVHVRGSCGFYFPMFCSTNVCRKYVCGVWSWQTIIRQEAIF